MTGRIARVFGTWEFGLVVVMAVLYLVGTWINPNFFGNAMALASVLRDAARFGVMAVGMSFVIINRDLDLSFVAWLAHPRRQHHEAIVVGQILIGAVDARLVT